MRVLVVGVLAALLLVPSASAWTWPADGPVLRAFSFSAGDPYAAGQHRGIDVAGESGASVPAPAGGTISFAGPAPFGSEPGGRSTALAAAATEAASSAAPLEAAAGRTRRKRAQPAE